MNYEHVSSTCIINSLLFPIIALAHLPIISLQFRIKSNSSDFIQELYLKVKKLVYIA